MKQLIETFPTEVRADILTIADNGGILSADRCMRICDQLSISIETLMISLLPIAASYSKSELSDYKVGAVALGIDTNEQGYSNLYLGTNIEFQSLYNSVHAEQSAVSNAWHDGQSGIKSIAVTAAPCGYCRQFLKEVAGDKSLSIVVPTKGASTDLSQLLPDAFGPADLGCDKLLMDPIIAGNSLKLDTPEQSAIVKLALEAANLSYAPYSLNYAGCAIELSTGELLSGRYAENVAHNPSLSAFSSALSKAILSKPDFDFKMIQRLVLVEQPTKVSQLRITKELLSACNGNVELEYYAA